VTNPPATSPPLNSVPPTVDSSLSAAPYNPSARLEELMARANSRGGVNAWEIAEIAKLRGVSPWAPLHVIIGKSIS
jgi:hypothetical protein